MPSHASRQSSSTRPLMGAGALLLVVIALYSLARLGSRGEVLGSVEVLDVAIGGMVPAEATLALNELSGRLAHLPVEVSANGKRRTIFPYEAGFHLDSEAIVAEAMSLGRTGNPLSDFFWWLTNLGRTTRLEPLGGWEEEAFASLLDLLDEELIGQPPFEGAIELVDGQPVARYPSPGLRIAREEAATALLAAFLRLEREPVALEVKRHQPTLTPADIDAARAEAALMLAAPVTLVSESGANLTLGVEDLRRAFVAETLADPPRIELSFDEEVVESLLAPLRSQFEDPPVDARFRIDGDYVTVVPGRSGTRLTAEETVAVLAVASRSSQRRAPLPLVEGAAPEVTTEELEALDIRHLVSAFTTYYECCQPRVTNIHLIAERVDGVIVPPGETFSLNRHVGRRTEADGFVPAGAIVGGEIVDAVGGGVSQFATTFYNAVFWGGYEDITHSPHSLYFERYPEGIEATISWPTPDLVFRNNTDSGILIKTEYTATSVTVKFFGNNDGRILRGHQQGGRLGMTVVAEGGPDARRVRGDRSERFDFREPPPPLYRANPELDVDTEKVTQRPGQGWSVRVTRTITHRGRTVEETWLVRYLPRREIIEVHPCRVPESNQTCPTTTTTTVPETTTTVGETTTTTTTAP